MSAHLKSLASVFVLPPSATTNGPGNFSFPLAGFRAIAFLWVTLFHVVFPSSWPLDDLQVRHFLSFCSHSFLGLVGNAGTYGVEIFSVLSRFLLYESLQRACRRDGRINVLRILVSRWVRLFPVQLAVSLLSAPVQPSSLYVHAVNRGYTL